VREARWQDRSGIPRIECGRTFLHWQQLSQSKIASDSHVNSRLQSTPTRAPSNRSQSRTNKSLACRLSKNAASSTSEFGFKADMATSWRNVCFVPKADIPRRSKGIYSITSSARAARVEGTAKPSDFAVPALITISIFVGNSTGKSPGLAPRKIRST
jgi:hypothetical protein